MMKTAAGQYQSINCEGRLWCKKKSGTQNTNKLTVEGEKKDEDEGQKRENENRTTTKAECEGRLW